MECKENGLNVVNKSKRRVIGATENEKGWSCPRTHCSQRVL